jgi:tRNA G10  N-methylase Trm11
VTDPPFGIREKAQGQASDSEQGDSITATAYLQAVAVKRLKVDGRLVFFLPTSINADRAKAMHKLQEIEDFSKKILSETAVSNMTTNYPLRLESLTESKLHSSLSRWLCVYTKDSS